MDRPLILFVLIWSGFAGLAQVQTCPDNINFASGDLRSWSAKTGLVNGASIDYPLPNIGVSSIPEYVIGTTGISVITSSTNDFYGGFPTIPTLNGYAYNYSLKIGSNSTSWDYRQATGSNVSNPGGFTRSVTYTINVPAGPISIPYTMTYAYAMVLENGTHNSNQQPLFRAELRTTDSVITCASPYYYLPTFNNAGGGGGGSTGATLDTAAAIANGFSLSPQPFFSHSSNAGGGNGAWLYDIWTKGWTEVTFDLSPYRGKQVTLTFESVNCTPGAHFAYAYVALRNVCAGLEISGNPIACTNTPLTYSIPALAGAVYNWQVPSGWVISSGSGTNSITVIPGSNGGNIIAHEINGCADLRDTVIVSTSPPTIPGQVNSDNIVCSGINSTLLTLNGAVGNILNWLSSTDGITWLTIPNITNTYTAQNLLQTTRYRARVQNGTACRIDTSAAAIVSVDARSLGGSLAPANINVCLNENILNTITLSGNAGNVINWQQSFDNVSWASFIPVNSNTSYSINSVSQTTHFRTIVQNGICPADTSSVATITFFNVPYPDARILPANASICIGSAAPVNAVINTGTSYSWSNASSLINQGSGSISSLPFHINAIASPPRTLDYVLTVNNAGCPNAYYDTFHVDVSPRIIVFAGNDTAVVAGQPLQLNATVNFPAANQFLWTPATGLNATDINNPVATLNPSMGQSIMYVVRATDPAGCYGEDNIIVTIYRTGPSIFIPSGFTPNGDGINDVIYPVCVGIQKLNFFKIFNRWGQMVFNTSQIGQGWDGRINGSVQGTNNYVYMAEGVDFYW
ncbi:MAG: gliding motility-associated C-terminal domain-containing protein [Chitinophagaceae bacterium]|nr:gliding motility-associated C-terminal domain-containing protein [Chitinophagaceae bacterium]